ncbi:MAG: hypothetical protein LBV32_00710 [Tannerellaceae bacterium]|nr:hypothetical protein [Tannerellaceae bacterium]
MNERINKDRIEGMTEQRIKGTTDYRNVHRYECRICRTDILNNIGFLEFKNVGQQRPNDCRYNPADVKADVKMNELKYIKT